MNICKQNNKEAAVLSSPLHWYAFTVATLWAFSLLPLVFHATHAVYAERLWFHPPFYDFGCYQDRMKLLHTSAFWTADAGPAWDYPAPGVFVYKFFYAFNRGNSEGVHRVFFGFLAYLIFAVGVLSVCATALAATLKKRGAGWSVALAFSFAALVFCWPIYFCLQRGNIEFALDVGISLGIWALVQKRWLTAALLFGAFGSAKLYPLILLILLLTERRWREFFLGVVTAGAVTMISSRYIGTAPIVAGKPHGLAHGLQDWVRANTLLIDVHRSGYDHSIYGALKLASLGHPERFSTLAIIYGIVAVGASLVLFATRFWKVPRLNQLLLVSVAAVLLPPTSFDYTLQLLIPSFLWLTVTAPLPGRSTKFTSALLVAFGVLFAPETFISIHGVVVAGQVKMLALIAVVWIALVEPFPQPSNSVTV